MLSSGGVPEVAWLSSTSAVGTSLFSSADAGLMVCGIVVASLTASRVAGPGVPWRRRFLLLDILQIVGPIVQGEVIKM